MKIKAYLVTLLMVASANASDHLDSLYLDDFPQWDIGDFFLWTGEETGSPVFMMTFNPLTKFIKGTRELMLDEKAVYQFKIDTNGDFEADIAYKITVIGSDPQQMVLLRKSTGADALTNDSKEGRNSQSVAAGRASVAGGPVTVIKGRNSELLFVGPRQDPFFFDFRTVESPAALDLRFALSGDGLPVDGSAANTFGPTNMTIVAVEVPELKGKTFTAWSTTSVEGEQVDRCGRASITAIFIPNTPPGRNPEYYPGRNPDPEEKPPLQSAPKQLYNTRNPVDDVENYHKLFRERLKQVQANKKELDELVKFYLPDVLEYDPTKPMGYPNGRNLVEDAVYLTLFKINPDLHYDEEMYQFPTENPQKLSVNFPYAASPVFFPPPYEQQVKQVKSQ